MSVSITEQPFICNTCGSFDQEHDCALVLLSRARWLVLHYGHKFNPVDKPEALALVEQSALVLARAASGREQKNAK
jgi:hypothetical protein